MTTPARASKPLIVPGRTLPAVGGMPAGAYGAELRPGEYIHYGKYRIESVIGRGSFAVVYGAEHVALRRKVAIKIVHVTPHTSPAVVQRFQEEARIAALVRHPNVLETYDTGMLPGGSPFLVIERIEGDTLASALEREPLPIRSVIEIGRQLARALTAIAAAGVVHRDIKPDNVMVRWLENGHASVKIVDFGVSKRPSSPPIQGASRGELIGTPQYMPPEQLRGEEVDVRADVYALGAVLYEAVTGRAPHVRQNFGDLMVAVLSEEIPRPRSLRPDCPQALEDILLTALERDRQQRFASPEQLVAALDEVAATFSAVELTPSAATRERAEPSAAPPEKPSSEPPPPGPSHWVSQAPTVRPPGRPREPGSLLQPAHEDPEGNLTASAQPSWRRAPFMHAALGASASAALLVVGWALWPDSVEPSTAVPSTPQVEAPVEAPASAPPKELAPSPAAPSHARLGAARSAREPRASDSEAPRGRHARSNERNNVRNDEGGANSTSRRASRKSSRTAEPRPNSDENKAAKLAVSDTVKAQRDQAMREALSALANGKLAQARASYREATRLDPNYAAAYRGLAISAVRLGQRAEAEDALTAYRKLAPGALDADAIATRIDALGN